MKRRLTGIIMTIVLMSTLLVSITPQARAAVYGDSFGSGLNWRLDTLTGVLSITLRSGVTGGSMSTGWSAASYPWNAYRSVISKVEIAAGVTNIGQYAFSDCVNLSEVVLPNVANGVTDVGQYAFSGCISLFRLDMPRCLASIGTGAFSGCSNLTGMGFGGTTENAARTLRLDDKSVLAQYTGTAPSLSPTRIIKAPKGIESYTIPETISIIDPGAFAYSRLQTVTIPASVDNIGLNAFSWSVFLEEAIFRGNAPSTLPAGTLGLFDNVAGGFRVLYYPYTLRWPTPPSTNWRGYTAIAVSSYITIDRPVVTIPLGGATQLKATVYPSNANQAVKWEVYGSSSLTEDIIDVERLEKYGVIQANQTIGWVDVIAKAESPVGGGVLESAPTRVYVVEKVIPVVSVALDKTRISLQVGGVSDEIAAVVYPLDATNKALVWSSSNTDVAYIDKSASLIDEYEPTAYSEIRRQIVPVGPGTATITVTTVDGVKQASCIVTVTAANVFVPVSGISLATTTISAGADVYLNELAKALPLSATHTDIDWSLVSDTTGGCKIVNAVIDGEYILTVPLGLTGTVVVEATVARGLADVDWGYPDSVDYTQRFTLTVVPFIPVTGITDLPALAFAGVPLQLKGTVNPVSASYRTIEWQLEGGNAGAYLDPATGIITAQWPGTILMRAIVRNGKISADSKDFIQPFTIRVDPYITEQLEVRANPGGSVYPAGLRQMAGGEVLQLTATPLAGYIFAGWNSTNGGDFADAGSTVTKFTMPGNATTVTAYFAYTGLPGGSVAGGGGGVILPTPVHYFTHDSIYVRNSGATFGHVTIRDYQLFNRVTLDGRELQRNAHYTANRLNGYTEVILANGYLDALNQGAHTLTVYFTDHVTVTAVFSVIWTSSTSVRYSDVSTTDWFYYGVEFVSTRGWMSDNGASPGKFRPSDSITQGEVIDTLYKMAGTPTVLSQYGVSLQGRDASLEWVRSYGILPINGVFSQNSPITRQDVAVLLDKEVDILRLRYPVVRGEPAFADEWQIHIAAKTPVRDMYRAGIINGRTNGTFVPLGYMTRAEFASLLQKFAEAVGGWGA